MTTEFDYIIKIHNNEILNPDEVYFFYYCVMSETLNRMTDIYEWNEDIINFLNDKKIIVKTLDNETIPQDIAKNTMYFSLKQNENKPNALFRHLRNAFSHHRIVHWGEYLHIKDAKDDIGDNLTMNAYIKFQDLKELCFLFFDQRTEFENANNI